MNQLKKLLKSKEEELQNINRDWSIKFLKADLHRQNANLFFGIPAEKVTKDERQSVKAVAFGVIYGKSAPSLAEDLGQLTEFAQKLINIMFKKFPVASKYLETTKNNARKTLRAVSMIGRVRHLPGYLMGNRSVSSAMDRRAPNSKIQGISSDEGFKGGRNLQKLVWNLFESQGQPLYFEHMNVVHDSSDCMAPIANIPLSFYLIEHAYTTLVHKEYYEKFGVKWPVGLEVEAEIGASLGQMWKHNGRNDAQLIDEKGKVDAVGMIEAIENSIKWATENLGWKIDKQDLKDMRHNTHIIQNIRVKELKAIGADCVPMTMLITKQNALKLGLRFAKKPVKLEE